MRNFFLILCLLLIRHSYAQTTYQKQESDKRIPNITTPEKATLLRYNDFPDTGFIGGTDISIPIYNLTLDGLDIPIYLSYNTKGVKVSDIASNTGLGWTLVGDGTISLQINDIHDFSYLENEFQEDFGFEAGPPVQERTTIGYLKNDDVDYYYHLKKDYKIDSSPDIYIINGPSLKNKFYLKKDPSTCPIFCGYNATKYDLTFLDNNLYKSEKIQRVAVPDNGESHYPGYYEYHNYFEGFNITNEKGFKYKFNVPSGVNLLKIGPWTNIISANQEQWDNYNTWYLDTIQSPSSSDYIKYTYEKYQNNYDNPSLQIHNGTFGYQPPTFASWFYEGTGPTLVMGEFYYNEVYRTRYIDSKRLKKINFEDGIIEFSYLNRRLDFDGESLDKIEVKNLSGKIIKTISLTYSYFLPKESNCTNQYDCLRLRLDKVVDSSTGEYTLSYGINNSNYAFPKRTSSKTDFLGYYNENSSDNQITSYVNPHNQHLYPEDKSYYYPNLERDNILPIKLKNVSNYTEVGTIDKEANDKSLIGLLTAITYPTRGGLNIEYENDDFEYLGLAYKLGTARIKNMHFFDNNLNMVRKINYYYKLENGSSSGQINFFTPPPLTSGYMVAPNNMGLDFNETSYVGYSRIVKEELGKGKEIDEYSNFNDYPDILPTMIYDCTGTLALTPAEKKLLKDYKFPYKNIIKQDIRRGKLIHQAFYSNDDKINPIKEIFNSYDYKKLDSFPLNYISSKATGYSQDPRSYWDVGCIGGMNSKSQLITARNSLIEIKTVEKYNGLSLESKKNLEYNLSRDKIEKNIFTDTDGNQIEETFVYPHQNQFLIDKNIVGVPLATETKKNGKIISKTETVYPDSKDQAKERILNNVDDKDFPLPRNVSIYKLSNLNISDLEVNYDYYDNKGNLQQYTTKSGISTAIVWGYNYAQPIAKIEGAKYSDVSAYISTIVAKSNTDNSTGTVLSEQDLLNELDLFRKKTELSPFQITTYTYDPLIGVRSITPPNGIRQVYIYNTDNNRLKEVRENSETGNLLKEYQYNYKH